MPLALDKIITSEHRNKSIADIPELSPSALKGVSESDAVKLEQAFGISTIREMGGNKFFPSGRFRVHFDGVPYRGNLNDTARVIVVGQDPSTDEALARRAFVGNAGQRHLHTASMARQIMRFVKSHKNR